MRLIDADALKEKAFGKRGGLIHTEDIDNAPTIQPEERTDKRAETHACDLISRQAAIDALRQVTIHTEDEGLAVEALENLPSAQPEIIRCKDCARFDKKRGCNLVEGLNIAKADSFCGYAERRTDDC